MKNSTAFASPSPRKRSRSDSDVLVTASNNSPKISSPIKRFKLDTPVVEMQTSTPTVANQKTPVFALPIKRFHGHIPGVKKTQTSIPATVKRKRTEDVCAANTLFVDILRHHLKIRSFVSPRDVLLFLGTEDRFRLLPNFLHKLDSMIGKIEHIYRTNLSAGVSLLLPGTKIRMSVPPSVAAKLVTLNKLFRQTDLCLKAYVRRSTNTPTVANQKTPVFALPIKRFHGHIPGVKKTQTSIPATVKRKRAAGVCTANTLFVDILQHHLKIRSFVSPRDVLLFLGTEDRFRLLPKVLYGLDRTIDRIEHIYRTNLSAGFSLLLPGTKIRMRVTPSVATKLVALDKLFRQTDLCLKAYVRRSVNTSSSQSSQDACLKKLN